MTRSVNNKSGKVGPQQEMAGASASAVSRAFSLLGAFALAGVAAVACVQQSNTYPIEVLSEMHYSQASRPQESPRLAPVQGAVVFQSSGGVDASLGIAARKERAYSVAGASELYRVNCSVCHGIDGKGDGPAAPHLTSPTSYFATKNGSPYAPPADLQATLKRPDFTSEVAYNTINRGVLVMPRFGALLSEEDIRQIVGYLFDAKSGIASKN
ncbi:MAG: cytochrome c [Dehalococcoidia bacterium]|nr:cytochrome c [Dehalococcoidia bacterium]